MGSVAQHWLDWAGYVDLAAIVGLIATLFANGLYRVYRCFFIYMAVDALETILALALFSGKHHRDSYAYFYLAGQSVKLILAVFVVLELFRLTLQKHPALAKFGRNTVIYILIATAAIAVAGLSVDRYVRPGRSRSLFIFFSFERTMDAWLTFFLIVISVYMTWFPVRLKRNSVLYIGGFMVYFLSRSAGLLLINLYPQRAVLVNIGMLGAASACLLVWLVGLRAKGENTTTVIGHRWDPAAMDRLLHQLDTINHRLGHLYNR